MCSFQRGQHSRAKLSISFAGGSEPTAVAAEVLRRASVSSRGPADRPCTSRSTSTVFAPPAVMKSGFAGSAEHARRSGRKAPPVEAVLGTKVDREVDHVVAGDPIDVTGRRRSNSASPRPAQVPPIVARLAPVPSPYVQWYAIGVKRTVAGRPSSCRERDAGRRPSRCWRGGRRRPSRPAPSARRRRSGGMWRCRRSRCRACRPGRRRRAGRGTDRRLGGRRPTRRWRCRVDGPSPGVTRCPG